MNIKKLFGYRLVKKEELEKSKKQLLEILDLKSKIIDLENNIDNKFEKPLIDFNLGDPDKEKKKERMQYVGEVATLYKSVLEPKIKYMISNTHNLLANEANTRELDQALKGGIFVLNDFLRWGELIVNEYVSYNNK